MATYLVCETAIDTVELHCPTGWVVAQHYDFQDLVGLLQFDPETFGLIFGICILLFITGLGAGHVARILNRH